MSNRFQVAIVGGGPVGVALAVELGLRGVRCALVERRTELQNIPKGQNLTPRTLEHFYFWGIEDALRAERIMPKGYAIAGMTAYGTLASDYWFVVPQRELIREFYYQDVERLPQYLTEKVLRKRMAELPNVTNYFGWTADDVQGDEAGVTVEIGESKGPGRETLTADYLVGCDGANSFVRSRAGIDRGGVEHDQLMVLAVFRSKDLHELTQRFPDRGTFNVMRPEAKGYWSFFGRVDVGESFFFHAPVPGDTTRDNYDFLGLLQRVAGKPIRAEFDYVGFWDMRIAVAQTYQVGRVLIAGDAAHSHPPYGGYGLNSGLEDAVNLGWKLAGVVHGWGGPKLIPSYSEERRPIFKETGEDFIGAGIERDAKWLEAHDPDRDKAEFERAWEERKDKAGNSITSYEPHYDGSPVVAGAPGATTSAHGTHRWNARSGHHLAPQLLSNGKNVFEELGMDFALLAFGADEADVRAFADAAAAASVPLKVVRDTFTDGRAKYEQRLILVRPDQFIAWTGDRAPKDVAELLARITGHPKA